MRPITVQVGPLAAAGTTKIGLSQTPGAAGWLVLNGSLGSFSANGIALSQSITGATAVLLNGANSQILPQTGATGAITGGYGQRIYITSAGNDSGITFAVNGLDLNGAALSETITGSNAGVAASANLYYAISRIVASGSTASTITVGYFGAATMDAPRRILITTSAAISFTIYGTNWARDTISETVTNSGASVASVLSYATVTAISNSATSGGAAITIGTNGVADSSWLQLDQWAPGPVTVQANAFGTVNYTLFLSNDDPNSPTNAILPSAMTWSSAASPFIGAMATAQASFAAPYQWAKITLNSESAGSGNYVSATFVQYSQVPY